jgi:hypothetical protein
MHFLRTNQEFAAIGGSRALGIEHERSDIDLLIIADDFNKDIRCKAWCNTLYKFPDEFYNAITSIANGYIYAMQWLYPQEFVTDNEFTDWIKQSRDALVEENKYAIYSAVVRYANTVKEKFHIYYKIARKRVLYALCYGEICRKYSSGIRMVDCVKATGEWREWIENVRTGNVSQDEVYDKLCEICVALDEILDNTVDAAEKPVTAEFKEIIDNIKFDNYADRL